jgi:dihydrolipoamide dehydrogenase
MTPGLPSADRDLVDILAKRIAQTMKSVLLETRVVQMKAEGRGILVTMEGKADPKEQLFDRVLVAVGAGRTRAFRASIARACRSTIGASSWSTKQRRTTTVDFRHRRRGGRADAGAKHRIEGVTVEVIAGENVAFAPRGDSGRRLHGS